MKGRDRASGSREKIFNGRSLNKFIAYWGRVNRVSVDKSIRDRRNS